MKVYKEKQLLSSYMYRCTLTKVLDVLSGLHKLKGYDLFYNYLYMDDLDITNEKTCILIRLPGRTIGDIIVDQNMVITQIILNDEYSDDDKDIVQQFIGEKIELEL